MQLEEAMELVVVAVMLLPMAVVLIWGTLRAERYRRWKAKSDAALVAKREWWANRERLMASWHEASKQADLTEYRRLGELAKEWFASNPEPSVLVDP